jgi:hypothetical protein
VGKVAAELPGKRKVLVSGRKVLPQCLPRWRAIACPTFPLGGFYINEVGPGDSFRSHRDLDASMRSSVDVQDAELSFHDAARHLLVLLEGFDSRCALVDGVVGIAEEHVKEVLAFRERDISRCSKCP